MKRKKENKKSKSDSEDDHPTGFVSASVLLLNCYKMIAGSRIAERLLTLQAGRIGSAPFGRSLESRYELVVTRWFMLLELDRIKVQVHNGSNWHETILNNVQYVPDFGSNNLFSLGAAARRGFSSKLDAACIKLERNGKVDCCWTDSKQQSLHLGNESGSC